MHEERPRLSGNKLAAFNNINTKERRILVIGDIHAPFELDGYFDFCQNTYAKWNCNQVIFIGDIIDSHYSSFHPTDPDGLGGGDELKRAIDDIQKWNKEFPVADVLTGNHDRIVMRKAFDSAIPKAWIKSYNEVLGTNWNWEERVVYDNVQFTHGEGGTARTRAKNDMMSSVGGHIHTQAYVEWMVGRKFRVFGMQVGCGVDSKSYAAAYAKNFKKQAIGCGVILGGHTAINCLMDL
jgi:predicted phosphodiesterase|tara:strand:- start:63 stop:773 length:711 start_codon:yes stop_codon:yes gene_type:complete